MREKSVRFLVSCAILFGLASCQPQTELKSIALSPQTATLAVGQSLTLQAFGGYSDGQVIAVTEDVQWSVSDASIVEISPNAVARALRPGQVTVRATSGKIAASLEITVTDAKVISLAITPAAPAMPQGANQALKAIASFSNGMVNEVTTQARWESSDTTIATVTNSGSGAGTVSARKAGVVTIRASYGGIDTSLETRVTNAELSQIVVQAAQTLIPRGTTVQLQAMGLYTDGTMLDITSSVLWSTADMSIAVVETAGLRRGLLTAMGTGLTQITATDPFTLRSASISMAVSAAELVRIELTHPSLAVASLNNGDTAQMVATGVYSDASMVNLTGLVVWNSTPTSIATVSPSGEVRGRGVGSAEITATFGTKVATQRFQVTEAVLRSITVVGPSTALRLGDTFPLQAYANYSDGSSQNVTTRVTWASGGASSALYISQDPGSVGLLWMGRTATSTPITATMGSVVGTATIQSLNPASIPFFTATFGLAGSPVRKREINWLTARINYGGPLGYREFAPIATIVVTNTSSSAVVATLLTSPGTRGQIYLDGPTGGTVMLNCTYPFGMGSAGYAITLP